MQSLPAKSTISLLIWANNPMNRLACKSALSQHWNYSFVILDAEIGAQGLKTLHNHPSDIQGGELLSELVQPFPSRMQLIDMQHEAENIAVQPANPGGVLIGFSANNFCIGLSAKLLRAKHEAPASEENFEALDKLRESEAKYRNLVQQLPVITYITSLETPGRLLYVSPQISQLGYAADDWLDAPEGLLKHVHPQDLSVTIEAYAHTYEHHSPLRCEYRLVDQHGRNRWFLDEANVVRDENGDSLFLQGVLVDITKDKETEQELRYYRERLEELVVKRTQQLEKQCEVLRSANANLDQALIELRKINAELLNSETRFRLLLESAREGIIGLDGAGNCTFVNNSALAILGYAGADILGQHIQTMLDWGFSDAMRPSEEPWLDSLLHDCANPNNIQTICRKDGSRFLVEYAAYPIATNGVVDSSVLVFRDVTESQSQFRKLAYQASHDPLTGLLNRSEFERRLNRVLNNMHSDAQQHALCFLDLDYFKSINDCYGHAAGDHALRCFSRLLKSHLRQRDTLARLGGDEFVLLLEHTTSDRAYEIVHQVCESLRNLRMSWIDQEFSLSASIGIAALGGDSEIVTAMAHADSACYQAKKNGRDQIYVFRHLPAKYSELPMLSC